MQFYRMPENSFFGLKNYPFSPHYIDLDGLRMHYIDEGPRDSNPILLLHGNPTWSYIYRDIIIACSNNGNRVIAPDMIGFGKSDKPLSKTYFNIGNMVQQLKIFIETLDLKNITLYGQDWGAILGLRLAAENEDRFSGLIISNGLLPTGEQKKPIAFRLWEYFCLLSPFIPVGRIVNIGCQRRLKKEEIQAYNAPFPGNKYLAGVRSLPSLVPFNPECDTWGKLNRWNKPLVTLFSTDDPITKGAEEVIKKNVPGSKGQDHQLIDGGHFLQEDAPQYIIDTIQKFQKQL